MSYIVLHCITFTIPGVVKFGTLGWELNVREFTNPQLDRWSGPSGASEGGRVLRVGVGFSMEMADLWR